MFGASLPDCAASSWARLYANNVTYPAVGRTASLPNIAMPAGRMPLMFGSNRCCGRRPSFRPCARASLPPLNEPRECGAWTPAVPLPAPVGHPTKVKGDRFQPYLGIRHARKVNDPRVHNKQIKNTIFNTMSKPSRKFLQLFMYVLSYRNQQQGGGAPPPPPPPPPMPGQGTVGRLKTEIPAMRAEPPACVQNAMMTKDKKPFTYTPGGLDLSQIKSPRMARRLTRNANSEGVDGTQPIYQQAPPQTPQLQAPQLQAPSLQVLPPIQQQQIPQPPPPPMPQQLPQQQAPRPQVVLPPPQQAARPTQVGTIYVPPIDSPTITLNKAPTPWLTRTPSQQQDQPPPWVAQQRKQQTPPVTPQSTPTPPAASSPQPQFKATPTPPPMVSPQPQFKPASPQQFRQQQAPSYQGPTTRVVPIQIQMIPVAQSPQPQNQPTTWQPNFHQPPPSGQQQGSVTRIIPIQIESDDPGPANQSPAFRVLQKMTSRDDTPAAAAEQMRRMQLSEDDRALMNRLRTQGKLK